jgi:transcriptional regulator with XRE-family HTH domain
MGQIKNEILLRKIALKIKKLREEKNITQEDFFNDTNIHIGRIERGKNNLTISTLDQICDYFEISLSDFFQKL